MSLAPHPPVNTYRVQLHAGFTFADAAAVVPYLGRLGVTHLYVSPITAAAPGSTHGYDTVDPTRLSDDLGGEAGFEVLTAALRAAGIGLVVDVVPNHMGIGQPSANPFWWDLLKQGVKSEWAEVFDIDWERGGGRVILPTLSVPLGALLSEFRIDPVRDQLVLGDLRLPLRPGSLDGWQVSAPEPEAFQALLDAQWYELVDWRAGKQRVNYRRFFEVDSLVGVRIESDRAFDLMHARVLQLVREGVVTGLRVDHPDGLRDPEAYLRRLRDAAPGAWVVVEKILGADERLPAGWACAGTTGYDFLNHVTRVLSPSDAVEAFSTAGRRLLPGTPEFETVADDSRAEILAGPLSAQIRGLGLALGDAVSVPAPETFADALIEVLARFDRYRTYHRRDALDPEAAGVVAPAVARARDQAARAGSGLGPHIEAVGRLLVEPPAGGAREAVLHLQQLMPAVQAKAIEDRAFYRDRSYLPANEVGGDPRVASMTPGAFHARMQETQRASPHRMLATATHDHKRGEDARARLVALASYAGEWERRAPRAIEALVSGSSIPIAPADAYLAVLSAIATLPFGMTPAHDDPEPVPRVARYVVKALREAAERTAWIDPDEAYEAAITDAVSRGCAPGGPVLEALGGLAEDVAHLGALTSLAQTVIKIAAPGVADTYQGTEGWDLTLVDPDNRRPPAYPRADRVLADLDAAGDAALGEVRGGWRDGRIKQWVTARGLRARRASPGLLRDGAYLPLEVSGVRAHAVLAFGRQEGDRVAIALVARQPGSVCALDEGFWVPHWEDTAVIIPASFQRAATVDVMTGRTVRVPGRLGIAEVLGELPVALLVPAGD